VQVAPGREIVEEAAFSGESQLAGRTTMAGFFYTMLAQVGVTVATQTFTHGLSIAPSLLKARIGIHQAAITATAQPYIQTIGTNIITVGMLGTLTTCDIEVFQQTAIVS